MTEWNQVSRSVSNKAKPSSLQQAARMKATTAAARETTASKAVQQDIARTPKSKRQVKIKTPNSNLRASFKGLEEIELYNSNGTGRNNFEKTVTRLSADKFLSLRMKYLEQPSSWNPHDKCLWTAPERISCIEKEMKVVWHYKPLEINEETRFKPRALDKHSNNNDSTEEKLRRATGILNKLSWTTLDKLTVKFLETVGMPQGSDADAMKETVVQSMELIVDKAMQEPHFAEMYAKFSAKLAAAHKSFKTILLSVCREQFDATDQDPVNLPTDPAERDYVLTQARKQAVGLVQFIGELYKQKLIKGTIMIGYLQRLLVHDDEERLECFTKLLTTIGERLHSYEDKPDLHAIWDQVYIMAGKSEKQGPYAPSTRIKFLLHDLIDLKESGWIQRRQEDKAKTIAQIHKDVAEEQRVASIQPTTNRGLVRSKSSSVSKSPRTTNGGNATYKPSNTKELRKAQSDVVHTPLSSLQRALQSPASAAVTENKSNQNNLKTSNTKSFLTPNGCQEKAKSILKEYFIGGDTDEAALSFDELVGFGHEGHTERGASVVEAGVFLVMEMKEEDLYKYLALIDMSVEKSIIDKSCLTIGLKEPLDLLRDIEIDAPLAPKLLSTIMAVWIQKGWVSLKMLESAPDNFLSDGRPEEFARQIVLQRGEPITEEDITVISRLMNDKSKGEISDIRAWIKLS